ncbi:MAG TPA: hypothetical protein VK081_03870 [Planctomycetota bacterium]|nr:hypothetical protein [Planctomycetota bacterium]
MARPLPQLALLGLVAATFVRALSGTYVYDDEVVVVRNPAIAAGDLVQVLASPFLAAGSPHWRPLTQVLLALGDRVGGAAAIHALALALHVGATLVAYRLARRLLGDARASFLVALLFALHPAQVESVAWCSALSDVLWGLGALLALDAHVAARQRGEPGPPWRAVGWFGVALLAKEQALAIPLLWLLADVFDPAAGARPRWRRHARALVALVPWLLLRVAVFGDVGAGFDRVGEPDLGNRPAWLLSFELLGRLGAVLLLPIAPDAMRSVPVDLDGRGMAYAALGGVALVGLAFARARGPRPLALGAGIALVVLAVPALRPAATGEYPIADRYLYVPAFGLALALAPLVRARGGVALLVALAAAFAVRSFTAIGAWSDQAAFVRAQLARGADARVHYMAGQLALVDLPPPGRSGERERALQRARRHFEDAAASARAPRFGGAESRARLAADCAVGLAWCAFLEEELKPRPDFRRPAEMFAAVLAEREAHAPAHVGLAACLAQIGDRAGAERHLLRALELEPQMMEAHHNLALLRAGGR